MKIGVALGSFHLFRQGGAEVQVSLMIDHFLKEGHDVFYICYGEKTITEPEIQTNSIRLYRIKKPWRGYKELNWIQKGSLYSILDSEKPDVLYQRGDYHFWDLISLYGKKRGVPVVTGLSMERHCQKLKYSINMKLLTTILTEKMKERYYRNSDLILSQTHHQKEVLLKNYGLKSVVLPNGHPVPKGPFTKDEPTTVVWVANIKKIKRPELFINIAKDLDGMGYKFIMIGRESTGQYQKDLKALIEPIQDLEYLGEKDLDSTNKIISGATLLVNTSSSEGFSNTFIQAWMRETPVITLDADPDDMIRDDHLGIRCSSKEKMSSEIKELLEDETRLKQMKGYVREFALERYDIASIGQRYLDLFNEQLKGQEIQ